MSEYTYSGIWQALELPDTVPNATEKWRDAAGPNAH
jgi:hypothetical protein